MLFAKPAKPLCEHTVLKPATEGVNSDGSNASEAN